MALQPITGYPSQWRAPFCAADILLGQGPSSAAAAPRLAHYMGPMTSAGTWTAGTTYVVTNEQDAITGAGTGSPLHRMIRKHLKVNPRAKLYATPYAASSGSGVTTATGTITWATTPTANGQTRVWVCGELVAAVFTTSSTVTTISTDIRDKINAKTWLPVTASISAGILTLTAKVAGASQGDGTIGVIRYFAEIDPGCGTTVAVAGAALGLGATAGADGATTEAAGLTTALANIANTRYYYMGFSVWSSSDTALIETHVTNKSLPSPGLRSHAFCGYTSTISNASTIAIARNTERHYIAWQKNSEHDTAELAAWLLAVTQKEEELDSASPVFDGYTNSEILPARSNADWPSDTDVNDAVTDGICVIKSNQVNAQLAMHVSTRSKNSAGTLDDFRATERHRISVMDDFTDTVVQRYQQTYQAVGFKLMDDPRLPNGALNLNALLPPKVMTPSRFSGWFKNIIREFVDTGRFQLLSEWNASVRVNIDPNNASRLEVGASGRTIDLLHQASFKLSETTPG